MAEYGFNDKETLDVFQKDLALIIHEDNSYKAYLFAKRLQDLLDTPRLRDDLSEKNFSRYKDMVLKARFVSLYKLSDQEVFDFFNEHFDKMFEIEDYNIIDKVEHFLIVNKYFLEDRDEFKEKLRKSLLENKLKITKNKIKINDKEERPSIANWLKDFRNQFMEKGFLDAMNLSKYFASSDNIIKLSDDEKKRVKALMNLYARLKIPSSTMEGIEENPFVEDEKGEIGTLRKGQFEKISKEAINIYNQVQKLTGGKLYKKDLTKPLTQVRPSRKVFVPEKTIGDSLSKKEPEEKPIETREIASSASSISRVEKLLQEYKNFELNLKRIKDLVSGLGVYKNDLDSLFLEFENNLKANQKDKSWAIIMFICENKLLNLFFKDNKNLLLEFKKYLSLKFSEDIIENIVKRSTNPETVSLYLQFLLNNKMKLSMRSSGLFGMHLANIFKKIGQDKYFPIVYGDVNLEQFVWREVVEENGVVKFK